MDETEKTQLIEKIVDSTLPDESFYEDQANSFKTAAIIRAQKRQEMIDFLESEELQDSLSRAIKLLLSNEVQVLLTDEEEQELQENLSKISEDRLLNLPDKVKEGVDKSQNEAISYQKIFDISSDSLSIIYKVGHHYFQNGYIEQALDIFTLLETLNPSVADFNYALGLCYQQKEQWVDAVPFFIIASHLDPSHVGARISLIECHKQLGHDQEVSNYFNEIDRIQKSEPEKVKPWLDVYISLKNQ